MSTAGRVFRRVERLSTAHNAPAELPSHRPLYIHFFPWTPVAIGIIHVAAASEKIDFPVPRKSARPQRENILASKTSLSYEPSFCGPGPRTNILPRLLLAAYSRAIRSFCKSGNLRRGSFQQVAEIDRPRRWRRCVRGFPFQPAACHASRRPVRTRCPRATSKCAAANRRRQSGTRRTPAGPPPGAGESTEVMVLGVVGDRSSWHLTPWGCGIRSHGDQHRRPGGVDAPEVARFSPTPAA